ncbi:threonylcarbamoyl-AMP synthase [Candidatus Wirthbacteria bacterium CG2_30_54_11]|uniref:L-threonylcarbamoyladenylate synthase n=1 Tax=Candidatus Wirthbacteria bacterium CG2_30_54_11 TaxID=1817892 RepID=A0A1J5J0X3_9BACT|nr:MAG: threonylcarbamoyl-AMP synthase [Candidatus Wirthbacteria bacterium CG2_30_54_11]
MATIVTLEKAVKLLMTEGIIVLPTDTVCGVSASLGCPEAIRKLYRIKERPLDQATALLIGSIKDIPALSPVTFSTEIKCLLDRCWPGGLTIIVPRRFDSLYDQGLDLVCDGAANVGLRIPDHPVTLEVIRALGSPLVASSANLRGKPAPGSTAELEPELKYLADGIIEGTCSAGVSSTVIDLTASPVKILREGFLTRSMLRKYLPDLA